MESGKDGTHYHDSYYRDWDRNMEVQFRKLSIPKADWLWCQAPLNLVRDLRDATTIIDIAKVIQKNNNVIIPFIIMVHKNLSFYLKFLLITIFIIRMVNLEIF